MTSDEYPDDFEHIWALLRVKRWWVPEWLWRALDQAVLRQPLRSLVTRDARSVEEALRWWEDPRNGADGEDIP